MQLVIDILGVISMGATLGIVLMVRSDLNRTKALMIAHYENHRAANRERIADKLDDAMGIHPRGIPEQLRRRTRPTGINWDEYRNGR